VATQSKRQKPYPALLRKKQLRKISAANAPPQSLRLRRKARDSLLAEVWRHFGVPSGQWQELALKLLERHVPAFKREHRGRAKSDLTEKEWSEFLAFDSRHYYGEAVLALVQARFAQCVRETARTNGLEAAFRTLVRHRQRLPERYRTRNTAASLKRAFMQIPKDIRENPERYIPGGPGYEETQRDWSRL